MVAGQVHVVVDAYDNLHPCTDPSVDHAIESFLVEFVVLVVAVRVAQFERGSNDAAVNVLHFMRDIRRVASTAHSKR